MRSDLLGKLTAAIGAAVAAGLVASSPAWADTTVTINPGNVPTTAAAYGKPDCDKNFGAGPYADRDVWVFVLPGNPGKVGDFVSVTATFGANGTLSIPADGGAVVTDKGASKAWITAPAGWTLTGASAVITGTAQKFNLTHTCPAGGGGHPPTVSPSPSASRSPASPAPTGGTNDNGSGGSSGGGSAGSSGGNSGSLPVTGTAVTGVALTGAAFVAAGIILLAARRRRNDPVFSADGEVPARNGDGS